MFIRNEFGLWGANSKLLESFNSGFIHADDVSMDIIKALWEKLQEKE